MSSPAKQALAAGARALVDAIEANADARTVFEALVRLIAFATQVEGAPPHEPSPAVPPVRWSLAGNDPLRRAASSVYRADSAVELRVRELHALVAPLVGRPRELAWNFSHAWGDIATSLVRPLWELAYG